MFYRYLIQTMVDLALINHCYIFTEVIANFMVFRYILYLIENKTLWYQEFSDTMELCNIKLNWKALPSDGAPCDYIRQFSLIKFPSSVLHGRIQFAVHTKTVG